MNNWNSAAEELSIFIGKYKEVKIYYQCQDGFTFYMWDILDDCYIQQHGKIVATFKCKMK